MAEQRVRAPELPDSLEWFNTPAPLRLADQRGKVVLLDFWTYSCINCLHVVPDLRYLEEKYRDGLAVIGIHSPKFPNERVAAHLQKAINRYHIRHPVANDPKLRVWRQYGIKAWPSLIFIDPQGYVLGVLRGEGRRKQLDGLIAQHLDKAEREGIVSSEPLPVQLQPEPRGTLSFPGKVLAHGNRVYISDSGHNRIIEATPDGQITRVFGSTSPGLLDGREHEAAFRNPQGLTRVDDYLYVADTGNHAIRRINLWDGEVQTVAGTGTQGRYAGDFYDDPLNAPLNSPWDVAHHNGQLFIAMAGQHQVWSLQMTTNVICNFVGSGREGIDDGAREKATLAQPSGLAVGESRLYIADSETSALRVLELPLGAVETLVGTGLFDFGDTDGVGTAARLQHPLGVSYDSSRKCLWIADTYNNKIKKMDTISKQVSSFEECTGLAEPGGLSVAGDRLWIANTNAHEIRCLDLEEGGCSVLELRD
jgi:thiol-disulfide isomerase/thioredoxin/DNA-binding beta-propeller fold protein YncE